MSKILTYLNPIGISFFNSHNIDFDRHPLNDWDISFMQSTLLFAKHSKCAAHKVGCSFVKNNTIISIGINGTISGTTNCNDIYKKINNQWYKNKNNKDDDCFYICSDQEEHHKWSLKHEIHAEINAIGKAVRSGISLNDSILYSTHSPCFDCAKALSVSGVKKILIINEYDNSEEVAEFLSEAGIFIYKIPSYLIE